MGHALQEIWRVLISGQSLIDLRPVGGQSRIEVVAGSQVQCAGLVDDTVDRPDFLAADQAVAQVVAAGRFCLIRKTSFDYAIYHDTLGAMKAYAEARWTTSHLPKAVLARTQQLIATSLPPVKLRIRRKIMIAHYKKNPSRREIT